MEIDTARSDRIVHKNGVKQARICFALVKYIETLRRDARGYKVASERLFKKKEWIEAERYEAGSQQKDLIANALEQMMDI